MIYINRKLFNKIGPNVSFSQVIFMCILANSSQAFMTQDVCPGSNNMLQQIFQPEYCQKIKSQIFQKNRIMRSKLKKHIFFSSVTLKN